MTGRVQPPPSGSVLAELSAEYCEHDGERGRCPMCRAAETASDPPPDPPAPPVPRPARPPVTDYREDDPRATDWWAR
jgi:hypothetical protein